jgi:WD40 repeat protein
VRRRVFAGGAHGEVLCWDLDRAQVCRCCRLAERPAGVRSLAVTRDGRFLAAAHTDHLIRIWDVDTEVVALTVRPPAGHGTWSVRFSVDDDLLVIGCTNGVAMVADRHGIERVRLVHRPEVDDGGSLRPPGDVHAAVFSPDRHWIATGTGDGLVRVFGGDGTVIDRFPHPAAVWDVAFRPDGRMLATGAADGNARLWNPRGRIRSRLNHGAEVGAVAFSADNRWLVTGGSDGTARVWREDEQPRAWTGAGGAVTDVAVRPDDPLTLATAHLDHTVRVWSLDARTAADGGRS